MGDGLLAPSLAFRRVPDHIVEWYPNSVGRHQRPLSSGTMHTVCVDPTGRGGGDNKQAQTSGLQNVFKIVCAPLWGLRARGEERAGLFPSRSGVVCEADIVCGFV